MNNSGVLKGMILAFVIVYLISPLDAMPGSPVDDLIVLMIGMAAKKTIGTA